MLRHVHLMYPNLRRHQLVQQGVEEVRQSGVLTLVDFLLPIQSSENMGNLALFPQRRDGYGVRFKIAACQRTFGTSACLADRAQVFVASLHEPQNKLWEDIHRIEMSIR